MRRILPAVVAFAVLGVIGVANSASPSAADEVIAMTKASWAAEMQGNTAESLKILADDYTEFNGDYPTRLDSKAMNTRLAEAAAGSSDKTVAAEMANEKVQVYGDVAILSYNYIGAIKNKEGKVEPVRAKSTRVYAKQGGQWKLVHANFAPAN